MNDSNPNFENNYIDLSSFYPEFPGSSSLLMGLSLKSAGSLNPFCSEGVKNREKFFRTRGVSLKNLQYCRQVHSRRVFDITTDPVQGREGDGIITSRKDYFLSVTAADCMPVFLWDPENEVIGLCHSGWKGTGIAEVAMKMMQSNYGTRPEKVWVLLGPAIGSCCYRVDESRTALYKNEWGEKSIEVRNDGSFLNIRIANHNLLEKAGVKNISSLDKCTACTADFGSFRREGPENYTRMAAYIGFSNKSV